MHLTHVAFSPNGNEVLLSYSGEHVYLFDVDPGMVVQLPLCMYPHFCYHTSACFLPTASVDIFNTLLVNLSLYFQTIRVQ